MDPSIEYLTVAGLAAITWFGVPGAGDAALVAAAISAARGDLDIRFVLVAAFIGALIGGGVGYWVGTTGGRAVIIRPGPFLNWRVKLLAKGDHLLARFGRSASVIALPIMCGVNEVPASTYIPFSTIGRLGWVLTTGGVAYVFGPDAVNALKQVGLPVIAAILAIALIVFAIYFFWSQRYPEAAQRYKQKLEGDQGPKGEDQHA
jgi:membrane protein DedA with SNARE-associated domain